MADVIMRLHLMIRAPRLIRSGNKISPFIIFSTRNGWLSVIANFRAFKYFFSKSKLDNCCSLKNDIHKFFNDF